MNRRTSHDPTPLDARTLLRVLLVVATAVLGVLLVAHFASAVAAPLVFVLLAVVIALGLNPLVVRLEVRLGVPRPVGSAIVVGGLVAAALAFLALVVPLVVSQGVHFFEAAPGMVNSIQGAVIGAARRYPAIAPLLEGRSFAEPGKLLAQNTPLTVTNMAATLGGIANAVVSGVLLTILVLFVLMSPEPIVRSILSGVPPRSRAIVERTLARIGSQLGAWLVGALTVSASVGVMVGLGLALVGFEQALLFGVIAAVTNLIPFVGPVIGMVPPVLTAVSAGHWGMALWSVGIALTSQQLDAYLLTPLIYGRVVRLHPASIIVAVLVFGALLGLVGVFLAVPLTIIIKALYEEVYLVEMGRPEPSPESVAQVIAAGVAQPPAESVESVSLEPVPLEPVSLEPGPLEPVDDPEARVRPA